MYVYHISNILEVHGQDCNANYENNSDIFGGFDKNRFEPVYLVLKGRYLGGGKKKIVTEVFK
ncbi:MAG: hypothetical protein JWR43_2812, partial [Phenylobacterium sp.]|nr:hypothetical protein [Phenylobacterium sp.]